MRCRQCSFLKDCGVSPQHGICDKFQLCILTCMNCGKLLTDFSQNVWSDPNGVSKRTYSTNKVCCWQHGNDLAYSESVRQNMGSANRGKTWTQTKEIKEKKSRALAGKKKSEEHCLNISRAMTGRKLSEDHKEVIGIKSAQFWENLTEGERSILSERISNGLLRLHASPSGEALREVLREKNVGQKRSPEICEKFSKIQQEINVSPQGILKRQRMSFSLTGRTLSPEATALKVLRRHLTMKANGLYGKSTFEDAFHTILLKFFREDQIERQYRDPNRYPFACDFYIRSLDLFIEIQGSWTHGFGPYDETQEWCQKQLLDWEEKALTSNYYKNAIPVWTITDVQKRNIASLNNLFWKEFFVNHISDLYGEAQEWLSRLRKSVGA